MKKVFLIATVSLIVMACSKKEANEKNEIPCPIVDKAMVPTVVITGFQTKYPSDTVITWFRKDSIGYCAYFIQPVNLKKLAQFDDAGIFVKEEMDTDNNGELEDSTGTGHTGNIGCECEIPK